MRRSEIPGPARGRPSRTRDLVRIGVPRSRLALADVAHPHRGVAVVGDAAPAAVERCAEYEPILLEMRHGMPVVSAADAWCQLGASLSRDDLVAAGDSALPARHRAGVTSLELLAAAAVRHRSKAGADTVAAALPLVRGGVESRLETLLRLMLRRHRLPEPEVAYRVDLGAGYPEHPDLAYPAERISIEYEGDAHRTDRRQWQRDVERYERFADAGWRVVRVTSAQLFGTPGDLAARVRSLIRERRGVRASG